MSDPIITVRAELVRAAMLFTPKGDEAKQWPERAGVRFEPSALGGVNIVALCEAAMIAIRDPEGKVTRPATLQIPGSLFDSAKRQRRQSRADSATASLFIQFGQASVSGVTMDAPEITLPFPSWRRLAPHKAYGLPPSISAKDTERAGLAGIILAGLGAAPRPEPGVRFSGVIGEADVALASFDAWPDAFAVIASVPDSALTAPWQRPIWALSGAAPEAMAS